MYMITLDNFENFVPYKIWMRGEEYYETDAVSELEEISPGEWTATVEGTDDYNVEISMDGNEIESWYCDCPYDGEICKHVVATLLAIRDNRKKAGNSIFSKMKIKAEETPVLEEIKEVGKQPCPSLEHFKAEGERMSVAELMDEIIDATGYVEELQADSDEEAESRLENIEELRNKIVAYEESCEAEDEKSTLSGFLEQVALVADIDSLDEETDYVVLMTLHSAKGLEFPHVYLAGLEDGIFPSYMTITADDPAELEEERRLCYVGITRAKENLTLTCARRRMVHGETQYNKMSRFLKEIPLSLLSTGALFKKEQTEEEPKVSAYRQAKQAFATKAFAATKPAQQFTVTKGKGPGYDVGDRVRHIKFGEGLVTQITEGGRDYEVTVDFDTAGTKKMFAMFAKLQKID